MLRAWARSPARPIARALKAAQPQTTLAAVEAVKRAVPRKAWPKRIHVATRTFQALRMAVNDELGELDRVLAALPGLLSTGGRAAVIAFHSLEDRRVKDAFRTLEGRCTCPPGLPVCVCGAQGSFRVLTRRAVQASEAEQEQNPRSRSARPGGGEGGMRRKGGRDRRVSLGMVLSQIAPRGPLPWGLLAAVGILHVASRSRVVDAAYRLSSLEGRTARSSWTTTG